jgi:hypothetical protein
VTTKYFCARHWASTMITREDFAKLTKGYGIREGGSKRALETVDFVSYDRWIDAYAHLLENCTRTMTNAKHQILRRTHQAR